MSLDFYTDEQRNAFAHAASNPSHTPEASVWDNFAQGAAQYTMRSLSEAGRAIDMAGAAFPVAVDAITGGTVRQDQYFKEHDEVFNRAVDYWTPSPGEVGTAGQVAGQLVGGVLQATVSPALLVGTTQLSTAEDLAREGVDPTTANTVGAIQGASMAVGIKLPFLGKTLATRVLSGMGGNLAQGTITAAASSAVLESNGYSKQAGRFDPWDIRARTLDAMLGAAFGGLAHIEANASIPRPVKLTPTEEAAVLVANQARHMEDSTPQGRPAADVDATKHAMAMRQAVEQVLGGERVAVDEFTRDMQTIPDEAQNLQRAQVAEELARIATEEAPASPPVSPAGDGGAAIQIEAPSDHTAASLKARQLAQDAPDLSIPTHLTDAQGNPIIMRASEAIAYHDAEVAHAQRTAPNIFKTAAHCLLGAL